MKSKITLLILMIAFAYNANAQWAIMNFMPYLENGQHEAYIERATLSTDSLKGQTKKNVRQAIALFEMVTEKSNTQMTTEAFDNIVKMLNIPIKYTTLENGLQLGVLHIGENYYWFLHNTSETHNRIVNLEGKFRTTRGIEYNNIRAGVSNESVKMVAHTTYPFEYEMVYYNENKAKR